MAVPKQYRTFCIATKQESEKIQALLEGKGPLGFMPDPTRRYWQDDNGTGTQHRTFAGMDLEAPKDMISQNELLIQAESEEDANNTLALIHTGLLLIYPDPDITQKSLIVYEVNKEVDVLWLKEQWFSNKFETYPNLFLAVQIWKAAIGTKNLIYALLKYKLSLSLYSFTPHSANPKYGELFKNYNAEYDYQTKAAFAIIAAFSVIEELGLEVRSSGKKPRFLNKDSREWNPDILQDVEERLLKSGIDKGDSIDWVFRGIKTKVEEDLKPYFGYDSQWANGEDVRDKTLTFPEAIHNASYLRNFIAAHKFNDLTEYISPYDVFSIQDLTRKILLIKLGIWKLLEAQK